jgi:beta-galactosidase
MSVSSAAPKSVAFSHNASHFLLDDRPLQIFSGELHYFRVPRLYWRDRLLKARALGLNAICTYMPWNLHEPRPGQFDFEGDGEMLDVAAFVRLAQEIGLYVILRPGPYICAEWDFGGLPAWLLADPACRIRCGDERYLAAVRRYIARVGDELSPLSCTRGGPIIMVQVENEYGSFSNDKAYLRALHQMIRDGGFDDGVLLFTSDGPQDDMLAAGTLPDTLAVANFGSKACENLEKLRQIRPNQPIMCGEYWCGWFDHWGTSRKGSADTATISTDIGWMVENNASFNIYMFHGGTNFGFTAGANHHQKYEPTVTGYDYWALLDEAGRPTAKYHAVREILASREGVTMAEIPVTVETRAIPAERIHLTESAPLFDNLPAPIHDAAIHPMEHYGQFGGGAILYRTHVAGLGGGALRIVEPHDYALVFLDGQKVATLDRRRNQTTVELPDLAAGAPGRLDILVWTLGRVNYGPRMLDRKGITERVELKHLTLSEWEVFLLPMDADHLATLKYDRADGRGPAFHRGTIELREGEIGDTFLDLRRWRAGAAWVNGHALGRFWRTGPQQTLFLPGCWLRPGRNEIVIFDLEAAGRQPLAGLSGPVLNEVPQEG